MQLVTFLRIERIITLQLITQKNVVKSIARYVKNISTHLNNLRKHLNRQQKSQYGLDYLFDNSSDKSTDAFKNARDRVNDK